MISLLPTSERVRANTPPMVNEQIRRAAEMRVHYFSEHPQEIEHRLWELDREWDIERLMQAWSAALTLALLIWVFITGSWWWFLLLFLPQGFALAHALHGWSPSMIVLRHLGFRTAVEIEAERGTLRVMRPPHAPEPPEAPQAPPTPPPPATPVPTQQPADPAASAATPQSGAPAEAAKAAATTQDSQAAANAAPPSPPASTAPPLSVAPPPSTDTSSPGI